MATIKGVWVFKDEVSLAAGGTALSQSVNFTSNGANYSLVNLTHLDGFGTPLLYYGNTLVFDLMGREQGFEGWRDEVYRYVDFGETEQDVSDAFRTYMDTNATPEAEPTPTDAVTIEYNGAIIASLKAGQTATLPCKDKPMHTDVVVSVPEGLGGANSPLPIEVATESDMTALLENGEIGGVYKYTGTTGAYENGALYVLEEKVVNLTTITIGGRYYSAEEGMTWREWVNSRYNTGGFVLRTWGEIKGVSDPRDTPVTHTNSIYVLENEAIISNGSYLITED